MKKILLLLSLVLIYSVSLASSLQLDSTIPVSTEVISQYEITTYEADMVGKNILVMYAGKDSSGKQLSTGNFTISGSDYDSVMGQSVTGTMQQAIGAVFYSRLIAHLGVSGSVGVGN